MADAGTKTITIKKKDGTRVTMTLEEFRASKKKQPPTPSKESEANKKTAQENVASDQTKKKKKHDPHPTVIAEQHLATTTPVKDYFKQDGADTSAWDAEDHKSLLDEEVPEGAETHKEVQKMDEIGRILDSVPFALPEKLQARLTSMATSRRKGIRTAAQLQEYFARPVEKGGLALPESQARLLVQAIDTVYNIREDKEIPTPKRIPTTTHAADPAEQKKSDRTKKEGVSTSLVTKDPAATESVAKPVMQDVTPPPTPVVPIIPDSAEISLQPTGRQQAQISEMREPMITGPVEEIAHMTVEDFIRLGNSGSDIAQVIEEKFKNLAKESTATFFEGKRAWYNSPLQAAYLDVLATALAQQDSIDSVLQQGSTALRRQDFDVILSTNKKLSQ